MSHDHHSHADELYDHQIERHDPAEGYDRSEPAVGSIFAFTAGSLILLTLVIVALQGYFEQVYQDAVHDKILTAPSSQLQTLRDRDNWNLSHYMYGDRNEKSGRVRIPIDKAMDELVQESSSGKLFYPAKASPVKKEDPDPNAPKF
ncbi:MAG: hypothetical protein ABL995_06225 [Bryobacteraceae bacterium]